MNSEFNFINWMESAPYLYNYNNHKNILIYSNIIFILIAICIIKYKENFNENKLKYSSSLLFSIIVGFVSAKYHHCQCHDTHKKFKKWLKIDILSAFILSLVGLIYYYKNIDMKIIYLLIITLFLYAYPINEKKLYIYIITHSIWHILTSFIFFLLIIKD